MNLMRRFRVWRLRLRSIARQDTVDAELSRELRFHFDALVAEHMADGMSPEDARQVAHRALGNLALLEETCRDQRRVNWLHDLRQDLTYGLRMLRRQPGFSAVAAISLALGIGANTAVLGALDALMIQRLPVPDADRLVAIQASPLDNPAQLSGLSLAEFAAYRDRSHAFESLDVSIRWASTLDGEGSGAPPERIQAQMVTPGWLTVLGIEPELGRAFTAIESRQNGPPVVVIGHAFWQRRFGGDPHILNTTLRVNGVARTIVGVMPATFRYQEPSVDAWLPLYVAPKPEAGGRLFGVRGRLKNGITMTQAQTELDAIAAQLAVERPTVQKGVGVRVRALDDFLFGWTREPLLTLEAAVALALFIGCANVAALLLSRASTRQREMELRVALGAGRARILRQLVTESVLLAIVGGVLGIGVAALGLRALIAMSTPPGLPSLPAIGLNAHVLGLLALLTLATGIVCGIAPARRRAMPREALVSAQLALALILLIGSGLLMNSFIRLVRRDLNFVSDGLLLLDFNVPPAQYATRIGSYGEFPYFEIKPSPAATLTRVLDRLRALPGAASVAGISAPIVDAFVLTTVDVILSSASSSPGTYFIVTPHLFSTIGTTIVRGRDFTEADVAGVPWFAIVNETAARRFWPGADPIGKRFRLDIVPEEQEREVIGVVRDIPTRHAEDPPPIIYASFLQQPSRYRAPWVGMPGAMTFMLRASGDPAALIPAVRRAVAEVEPNRPLPDVRTVDARADSAMAKFRSYVVLVAVFAFAATLLAAIGTYGVMAYTVSQRTREIGIRRALGAGPREIVAIVGRRALTFVLVGLLAGLAGALALTRLIASQLWGVTPTDPATYAGVSVLLVAVAVIACVVPIRRAMAVDPTVALRSE